MLLCFSICPKFRSMSSTVHNCRKLFTWTIRFFILLLIKNSMDQICIYAMVETCCPWKMCQTKICMSTTLWLILWVTVCDQYSLWERRLIVTYWKNLCTTEGKNPPPNNIVLGYLYISKPIQSETFLNKSE